MNVNPGEKGVVGSGDPGVVSWEGGGGADLRGESWIEAGGSLDDPDELCGTEVDSDVVAVMEDESSEAKVAVALEGVPSGIGAESELGFESIPWDTEGSPLGSRVD